MVEVLFLAKVAKLIYVKKRVSRRKRSEEWAVYGGEGGNRRDTIGKDLLLLDVAPLSLGTEAPSACFSGSQIFFSFGSPLSAVSPRFSTHCSLCHLRFVTFYVIFRTSAQFERHVLVSGDQLGSDERCALAARALGQN